LEAIEASGSISGAGRLLKMSYKRAWDLIEDLNNNFAEPMVITATGGSHGGGAQLTSNGKILIKHYREIEQTAHAAVRSRLHLVGKMTLGTN
jgi:molybdate transport system regulatory protein